MNDLRSSVLKARLSKLPAVPPWPTNLPTDAEEQEEADGGDTFDQGSSSSSSSDPSASRTVPPLRHRDRSKLHAHDRTAFSPITAEAFFEQALQVDVRLPSSASNPVEAHFRVYYTPPRPARQLDSTASKHGEKRDPKLPTAKVGSLQDVSLDAEAMAPPHVADEDSDSDAVQGEGDATAGPGTLFVFHHGAGFSALSYALTAAEITKSTHGEVGVLAFDCRGHGRTQLSGAELPLDMSLPTLSSDLVSLLTSMFPEPAAMPSLVLVGHSMGGSVVVSASEQLFRSGFSRISGVAVLDVVEGTAMDALEVMRSVVLSHPRGFGSVEEAIEWHIDSRTIANPDSARVSVPPLVERDRAAAPDDERLEERGRGQAQGDSEPKEVLVDEAVPSSTATPERFKYRWRADLLATEPHWKSWFQGLSSRFLAAKTARLLLLAGTDRLDRELMIGQMQGKYQLAVIPDVGHCLQEDAPEKTASILVDFWRRNERTNLPLKGIKKVGEA